MTEALANTTALLRGFPAVLNALLRDLPEYWVRQDEGEGTWSAYDVVGHLIHGERTDWMARTRIILESGPSKIFERFDRWAQMKESQGKSLADLLDEFGDLRRKNLRELENLNLADEDLTKQGTHPVFGAVTLGQLLHTWAAHDLTHLHQLSRIMAHQHRDLVGPWTKFLGVMQCQGHSE